MPPRSTPSIKIPRRGYRPAPRRSGHRLSAFTQVVIVNRRSGTFTVEANEACLGPRRQEQPVGTFTLRVTAPLVELSPRVRRRLRMNQALTLRVDGTASFPIQRRWKAWYWTTKQVRAINEDAQRLMAKLVHRSLVSHE